MMKKRSIVMIIAIIVGIIICGGISFLGYKYINANKTVNQGIEYMKQKDYDKAIVSFDLVADNSKAIECKDMINKYLDSKKILDNGQIDEADKK